ncbi:MAG: hypothetical protein GXO40_01935 [Epsilonproteobacteria bacterium]|nr:hypothetical protein [Campylobacterota bacterium]
MNIAEFLPIAELEKSLKRAKLNEHAKRIFSDKKDLEEFIVNLNLDKSVDVMFVKDKYYMLNIIKTESIYILFTETDNANVAFNSMQTKQGVNVDVYQRAVLREFLEKFLALKKRYGGFNIRFLYLRLRFTMDIDLELKKEFVHKILKYTIAMTRNSDVVGQLSENSFGVILTNEVGKSANVVVDKILKYITDLNAQHQERIIEVYGALAHELFILKYPEFETLIAKLEENSEFVTVGTVINTLQ